MPEPIDHAAAAAEADFERRWSAWKAKNRKEDQAFQAKLTALLRAVLVLGVCALVWYLFAPSTQS
jgi:hypothetical protein